MTNLSDVRLGRDSLPVIRNIIHQYDDAIISDLLDEIDRVAETPHYITVYRSATLNELVYKFQVETNNTSPLELSLPGILRELWRMIGDEVVGRFRLDVKKQIEQEEAVKDILKDVQEK